MNDDEVFDKWLKQANNELIESVSDSLDIEDALASVKRRGVTDLNEASSDHCRLVEMYGRVGKKVSSLSVFKTGHRLRRVALGGRAALIRLFESKGLYAVIGSAVTAVIFVATFTTLPGNDSPIVPFLADSNARISKEGGSGDGNGTMDGAQGSGREADEGEPHPPPAHSPSGEATSGQPIPIAPGETAPEDPLPRATREPVTGDPVPGEPVPEEPTAEVPTPEEQGPQGSAREDPGVQKEMTVALSAEPGRESIEIDRWQKSETDSDDLHMDQSGIYTMLGAKLSIVNDSNETTYSQCAKVTNWTTRVDFSALQEGSRLCAQSHTGRQATLKVTALPESTGGTFIFDGKTWKFPEQPRSGESRPEQPPAEQPRSGEPTPPQTPSPQPPAEPTPPPQPSVDLSE